MCRRSTSVALAALIAGGAVWGIAPSSAFADDAPKQGAAAAASGTAEPGATPAASPPSTAATAVAERHGVVVVLLGPVDAPGASEARAFARSAYKTQSIRPGKLGEAEVRVLAGEPVPPDASPSLGELSATRAELPASADDPTAAPALENLASKLGVRALVLYVPTSSGGIVQVVHTDVVGIPRIDPASVIARPTVTDGTSDYAVAATSVERIVGPEPITKEPPPATKTPPPKPATTAAPKKPATTGPRRADAKGSNPHGPPEAPPDDENFWESPWFWVAAGTVAAVGVTIIVVTQTTDVNTGTVSIGGKVLQ